RDSSHSRSALSSALQVVPTVPVAEPRWAWVLVELAIAYWRAHGWPQVDATPNAGRAETVSRDHLPETSAWLARLLEVEPVATEETGMADGCRDGTEPGRFPWPRRLGSRPRAWTALRRGRRKSPRPAVTQRRQRTPRPDDGCRGLSNGAMMPSRPLAMISAMSPGVKRMCLKIRVKGTSRSRA